MRVAAVIPAWNEADTVAGVVLTARDAGLVDEVIVVDNNSTDATARVAAEAGARVVHEPCRGKGEAMRSGVAVAGADVVVFLDADLLGLTGEHVDDLVRPVLDDEAAMVCGLFDRGPFANPVFLRKLPVLTGQRALRRELFEALDLTEISGYRVEAALNSLVADRKLPRVDMVCDGLWHRTKEEKFASPAAGFLHKQAMLLTALWSYIAFAVRRRLLAPTD
jgi:glycosyltransferase involved in cell wall biosynthesis